MKIKQNWSDITNFNKKEFLKDTFLFCTDVCICKLLFSVSVSKWRFSLMTITS